MPGLPASSPISASATRFPRDLLSKPVRMVNDPPAAAVAAAGSPYSLQSYLLLHAATLLGWREDSFSMRHRICSRVKSLYPALFPDPDHQHLRHTGCQDEKEKKCLHHSDGSGERLIKKGIQGGCEFLSSSPFSTCGQHLISQSMTQRRMEAGMDGQGERYKAKRDKKSITAVVPLSSITCRHSLSKQELIPHFRIPH